MWANACPSDKVNCLWEMKLGTPIKLCIWMFCDPALWIPVLLLEVIGFTAQKYFLGAFQQMVSTRTQIITNVYLLSYSGGKWGIISVWKDIWTALVQPSAENKADFQIKTSSSGSDAVNFENIWDVTASPTPTSVLNHSCDEDFLMSRIFWFPNSVDIGDHCLILSWWISERHLPLSSL